MSKVEEKGGMKVVSDNRKARFDYHLIEFFEVGVVLTGAEIKSIRQNGISIAESYVRAISGELFLLNAHIKPYSFSTDPSYDPIRERKLLMKKREIERLAGRVSQQGLTLVPVKLYFKRGIAKLEIALAKGKAAPDKRQDIKRREGEREIERYHRG